jgi:SM-20-related protein
VPPSAAEPAGEPGARFGFAARRFARHGWAILDAVLPTQVIDALRLQLRRQIVAGTLRPAEMGRGSGRHEDPRQRGDRIAWLPDTPATSAESALHALLEAVKVDFNSALYLGLWSHEAHFAHYVAGARYARHRDQHRDSDARRLSFVLYLNSAWRAQQGGELRMYLPRGTLDVLPLKGRLLLLDSERLEHEVLPATRDRLSIAGWFRRREQP